MKIKKENVLKAFRMFSNIYQEFSKRLVNKEKMEEMIEDWTSTFEAIDFDYEEANDDFIKAVKVSITKCKYVPTIAEIMEEIRNSYNERKEAKQRELQNELWKIKEKLGTNYFYDEKTAYLLEQLKNKYSIEQIQKMIQEKIKEQPLACNINNVLAQIVEEENEQV